MWLINATIKLFKCEDDSTVGEFFDSLSTAKKADITQTLSSNAQTNIETSVEGRDKQITSMVNSLINEEKEKSKRRLNLIIHNVEESTAEDGLTRKQQDIDVISSIFQEHLEISPTITKAFRLSKRGEKPKITVSSDTEKSLIFRNSIKLRNRDNEKIRKIFITPDLTPKEQEINRKLHSELRELNKDGRNYQIKNVTIVRRS